MIIIQIKYWRYYVNEYVILYKTKKYNNNRVLYYQFVNNFLKR